MLAVVRQQFQLQQTPTSIVSQLNRAHKRGFQVDPPTEEPSLQLYTEFEDRRFIQMD